MLRPSLVFSLFGALISIVVFLFTSITLDVAQTLGFILVFLCNPSNINPNGCIAPLSTFKMLDFFGSLGLRLTISKRGIVGLSFVFIPVPVFPIGIVFFVFLN